MQQPDANRERPPEVHDPTQALALLQALAGPLLSSWVGSFAPDLTEGGRSQAASEAKNRLSEVLYRTLLEQIPAVTFMASLEHGLQDVYVSPQIESLLGYTQREWLENPVLWYERLHPDDKERWNVEFARTVAFGEPFHSVYRFLARNGTVVWILGDTKIVRNESGRPLFIQGVGFDITDLKKTEEALRRRTVELDLANKELETFSYSISHDLRTPLRGIEGFSHILLEDYGPQLDERGRQYLERVKAAANRMAQLIDEFLNLHRITRKPLDLLPVNLSEMAEEIAEEFRLAEPGRAVEFRIARHVTARADPELLRVVLTNLLGNAWKFTGKCVHAVIEFGGMIRNGIPVFFVRDNGAGFDMAFVHKLFKPFERLHRSEDYPGNGIGLATIQRVIERHGGSIWAEGSVEGGATFTFSLER